MNKQYVVTYPNNTEAPMFWSETATTLQRLLWGDPVGYDVACRLIKSGKEYSIAGYTFKKVEEKGR